MIIKLKTLNIVDFTMKYTKLMLEKHKRDIIIYINSFKFQFKQLD